MSSGRSMNNYWSLVCNNTVYQEQREEVFISNSYMKIFEDNGLNNFDKYFSIFSQIFVKYLQIKVRDSLLYSKLLQNKWFFVISSNIRYRFYKIYTEYSLHIYLIYIIISLYTREIPAFGGISLVLRGSGASGATFGRLRRPRWGASGAHSGNRRLRRRWKKINEKIIIFYYSGAPFSPSVTDGQTDVTSSTVLVYRYIYL